MNSYELKGVNDQVVHYLMRFKAVSADPVPYRLISQRYHKMFRRAGVSTLAGLGSDPRIRVILLKSGTSVIELVTD